MDENPFYQISILFLLIGLFFIFFGIFEFELLDTTLIE